MTKGNKGIEFTHQVNARNNINGLNGVLQKNYDIINHLLENFSNQEGIDDEETIANFLNEGKFKLVDLQEIVLDIDFLKKIDQNNIILTKVNQTYIAKLFLGKLKEKIEEITDTEKKEYLLEKFEIDFKQLNKKNPLKTIIQNLEDYSDFAKNITITNKEFFEKAGIQEQIIQFNETSPATQSKVINLLTFEMNETLSNYQKVKTELFQDMEQIFSTGKSDLNHLFKSSKEFQDLHNKKDELENEQNIEGTATINKEIRDLIIEQSKQEGNTKLANILEKLVQNNFNFTQLQDSEKQLIIDLSIQKKIDKKNKFAKLLENNTDFDLNKYNEFLDNIYNISEKESKQTIKRGDKNINLKIKKDFEKGEHNLFQNFDEFKNMEYLPLSYTINIDDNDENIINEIENPLNPIFSVFKNNHDIITSYTTKNGNIMIGNGYILEIGGKKLTKKILDHLLNCNKNNLENELKSLGLYDVLKDTYEKVKQTNNNRCLFEQILANIDLKITKRNLILKGSNIDKLSQLYLRHYNQNTQDIKKMIEDDLLKIEESYRDGGEDSQDETDQIDENTIEESYRDGGKYAQEVIDKIEDDTDENNIIEDINEINNIQEIKDNYKILNKKEKNKFKNKIRELCDNYDCFDDNFADKFIEYLDDENDDENDDSSNKVNDPNAIKYTNEDLGKEEDPKNDIEKFNKLWNGINGNGEFKKGTTLFFKKQNSELPPHELSDSYYKFVLGDIPEGGPGKDKEFEITAYGNELGLTNITTYKLPYTHEHLKNMIDGNEITRVKERQSNNRNVCIDNLKESKIINKFNTFGLMDGQTSFKGNKFVKKGEDGKETEVKYFCLETESIGKENTQGGTKLTKYEISNINTNNGTVTISTNFNGQDEIDVNKKVKYEYKKELPFDQFILLIESKNLKGYSEEEIKNRESNLQDEDTDRLAHRGLFQRVSIGNFKNIAKGATKRIKDEYKAQNEVNEEQLNNWLFSREGLNLYKHLGNVVSFGGVRGDMKSAFDSAELDYYNDRDRRIWKKIDTRYKKYADDPFFSAGFSENIVGILTPGYKGDGKKRYQVAGAFLAMLKKEGPYPRKFQDKEGTGYRIEIFLGKDHKEKYLKLYNDKKAEIQETRDRNLSGGEKMKSMAELQKLELQYIIDIIDDSGKNAPSNASNARKSIRSNQFKEEISTNMNNWISGFNKESEAKDFTQAKENFINNMQNNKQYKSIPELIKMCETASRPEQIHEVKGYLLYSMIQGLTTPSTDATKKLRKTARSMGFLPGFLAKDTNCAEKINILLKGISENDSTIKNFNIDELFNGKDFKGKYASFKEYRGDIKTGNGTKLLNYIDNPWFGDNNSINNQAKEGNEPYKSICKEIIKKFEDDSLGDLNYNITGSSGINYIKSAPLSATMNTLRDYFPKGKEYPGLKEKELIPDADEIWNNIARKINETNEDLDFYLKYYKRIFGDNYLDSTFFKSIALIKKIKNTKNDTNNSSQANAEAKYIRNCIFDGNMEKKLSGSTKAFQNCYKIFSEKIYEQIDKFDKKQVLLLDKDQTTNYESPYGKINWNLRNFYENNNNDSNKSPLNKIKNNKAYNNIYNGYSTDNTINCVIYNLKKDLKSKGIQPPDMPDSLYSDTINIPAPKGSDYDSGYSWFAA